MIVAFFGKVILIRFVAWVENPSVEAAEFEFFGVIIGLSGDLQPLIICLYCLYFDMSKIFRNVVICALFGENEQCDPAHIFMWFMNISWNVQNRKSFSTDIFVGAALVIRSQYLIVFASVGVYLIKLDMISYDFHKFGRYLRSRDCLVGFGWLL